MKYGVPVYDSEGNVIGFSYDNDGDGFYDDYTQVVSKPIHGGDEFSVVTADEDGDGVYDDTIYVSHSSRRDSYSSKSDDVSSPRRSHYSGSGSSIISCKTKLKIALYVAAGLFALSILSKIIVAIAVLFLR